MINLFSPETSFSDVAGYAFEWISGVASALLPDWAKIVLALVLFVGIYILGKIFFGGANAASRQTSLKKYNSRSAISYSSSTKEPPPLPVNEKDADF